MDGKRASPPRDGTPASPCRYLGGRVRRFPTPNVHERIHAAAARAAAAEQGGLQAVSVEAICFEAEIPLDVFHEHFDNPTQAALSAVESFADVVIADCRAVLAAADGWAEGIWDALAIFISWGASEPDLARLATIDVLDTGPEGIELLRSIMDAFAIFLAPGYRLLDQEAHPAGSLDEAIAAGALSAIHHLLKNPSKEELSLLLPTLAHKVLTPFLGEEEADRLIADRLERDRRA